jgi:SPX domain protein involved in polyphosphate accumulation
MADFVVHGSYIDLEKLRMAPDSETFSDLFSTAVASVHAWSSAKAEELSRVVKELGARKVEDPQELNYDALSVTHELLRFCEGRNLQEDAVNEILKECNALWGTKVSDKCRDIWINRHPFHTTNIDAILLGLNAIFAVARRDKQLHEEKPPGSEGTQSFERRSIKFWVHPQDLPTVYATVSRYLPVDTDRSKITSIYFDTPDLQLYHQRMERSEGSFLIRIRWYGDKDKDVFIERKVHHEAWIGELSTKQRFSIAEKLVNTFIKGQWDVRAAIEALQKKGARSSEVRNFAALVNDVLHKFQNYDLQPMLRSQYVRTAFQFANSAAVRVSIDTNMVLSRERAKDGNWRATEPSAPEDSIVFPYAVCEVKLQLERGQALPPWVANLMQHSSHMESIPKFSKYGHGICSLYGERARLEPYWLHQLNNDIRAATKIDRGFDIRVGIMEGCVAPVMDEFLFGESERAEHVWEFSLAESKSLTENYMRKLAGIDDEVPNVCHHSVRSKAYRRHGISQRTSDLQCSCAMCTTAEQDARNGSHQSMNNLIPWQTEKSIRVPKKTDPKTFITSERYLLHWVSLCVGVAFGGVIALTLGQRTTGSAAQMAQLAGLLALVLSIGTMLYALIVYRVRTYRMFSKTTVRYDDTCGPMFLTLSMMLMILLMASVPLYSVYLGGYSLTPILNK